MISRTSCTINADQNLHAQPGNPLKSAPEARILTPDSSFSSALFGETKTHRVVFLGKYAASPRFQGPKRALKPV
jgi:hypothetical protein